MPPRDAGDKSPHSNARPAVSAPVLTWDKGKKDELSDVSYFQ